MNILGRIKKVNILIEKISYDIKNNVFKENGH